MIRTKIFAVLFVLAITLTTKAGEEKYGKQITLEEKTSVSAILANPEKYNGKTVLVEGKVLAVCQNMGCWIEISGEKENEKIMIKVEDGVIVFPKDAKGKTALVEGTVAEVLPKAEAEEHEGHEKEHEGDDACSPKEKTYRINGIGAVIK